MAVRDCYFTFCLRRVEGGVLRPRLLVCLGMKSESEAGTSFSKLNTPLFVTSHSFPLLDLWWHREGGRCWVYGGRGPRLGTATSLPGRTLTKSRFLFLSLST